jgi:hypothetical protein
MKINPLGIRAYQHLDRQDRSTVADTQVQSQETTDSTVLVEPQSSVQKSALAVKAPSGSYAKFLSPAEREAIDMLFARFGDSTRFGSAYNEGSENTESNNVSVGRLIDVTV